MDTIIHADIFFFITTIAVIVVSIFIIIALFYLIKTLRQFKRFTDAVERGLDGASDDLKEMRERIMDSFLFNLLFPRKKRKKKEYPHKE